MSKFAIVGCGGIAWYLADPLTRHLSQMNGVQSLYLIDGDTIEEGNLTRQFFQDLVGWNKAEALADVLKKRFGSFDVDFIPVADFINAKTARRHKREWFEIGTTMFLCLDNDPSRCFIEDHAKRLREVVAISGGNDDKEGQAQMWIRKRNKDLLPSFTEIAPEIRSDRGKLPDSDHCLVNSISEPQTALVNQAVAVAMMTLFRHQVHRGPITMNEIRVNVETGTMNPLMLQSVAELCQ